MRFRRLANAHSIGGFDDAKTRPQVTNKKAPTDRPLTADKGNHRKADGSLGLNSPSFILCRVGNVV
jgi:hypothetical protein